MASTTKSSTRSVEDRLRSYLRSTASRRSSGYVTADDAHAFMSRNNIRMSQRETLSLIRSVLNESEFVPGDFVPSNRPVAKGRNIVSWYLS